jgi:type IV pilus assembly protein PilQ
MTVVDSVNISDRRVEVGFNGEFSSSYSVQKSTDPYLAVIELPGVAVGDFAGIIPSEKSGISEVRLEMLQTPVLLTRIEVVFSEPLDLVATKRGDTLLLDAVESGVTLREESAKPLPVANTFNAEGQEVVELLPATEITAIGITTNKGETKLLIYGDGSMEPDIFTLPGRIVVDIPAVAMKAPMPSTLHRPINDIRFGTYGDKVRIVLDVEHDGDFLALTEDNKISLSLAVDRQRAIVFGSPSGEPLLISSRTDESIEGTDDEAVETPEDADGADEYIERDDSETITDEAVEAPQKKGIKVKRRGIGVYIDDETAYSQKYTGKKISLDFQDADVVPIYRFLAEIGEYNVVIHPSVSGRVTLKLTDVPWDHALDIILELTSSGKQVEGNILRIAPASVFVQQTEAQAKLKASKKKAADMQQVAIPLKYIAAAEMKIRIDERKNVQMKESGIAIADRGTIRVDERTNTIIVSDTAENITWMVEEEVPYWDTPEHTTLQVLIEAKIVSVRTDYTHNLGIRWGGSATNDNFSFINDSMTFDLSVNTPVQSAGAGVLGPGGLLSIGYAETFNLNLSLSALETVQKAKSLANPRVITIDKQPAMITKGTAIPYATSADGGGTKIQTVDASLTLNVTPEIQPNGIIKLDVSVTNDSPTTIPGADAPGIDKQQIETTALVKDGETLVLGGIFTNSEEESEIRVPVLSRIPLLGWLFKTRSVSRLPNELLIFITPRIIK